MWHRHVTVEQGLGSQFPHCTSTAWTFKLSLCAYWQFSLTGGLLQANIFHFCFRLRHIPYHLLKYPVQAVRALLAGFKPSLYDKNVKRIPYCPEWSVEALWAMMECVEGKQLSASILVRNTFFFPPLLVLAQPKMLISTLISEYLFYCESS